MKNPDAIAVIVSALRHAYGDDVARMMLVEGMSLANLIDAMFAAPLAHREAVRAMTEGLDDFVITPDLGPMAPQIYLRRPAGLPARRGLGDRHAGRYAVEQGRSASSRLLKQWAG